MDSVALYFTLALTAVLTAKLASRKQKKHEEELKYQELVISVTDCKTQSQWSKLYGKCIEFLSRTQHPSKNEWNEALKKAMSIQIKYIDRTTYLSSY
jgi:hypothetical protein